jgi:hypothetical protein
VTDGRRATGGDDLGGGGGGAIQVTGREGCAGLGGRLGMLGLGSGVGGHWHGHTTTGPGDSHIDWTSHIGWTNHIGWKDHGGGTGRQEGIEFDGGEFDGGADHAACVAGAAIEDSPDASGTAMASGTAAVSRTFTAHQSDWRPR